MNQRYVGTVITFAGLIFNAFLAYSVFCDVRNRASRWPMPQQRGFAVILRAEEDAG